MLVKDRMTPNPIKITSDTSFLEAFRIIREEGIRHLPVMDNNENLVGIVAKTDLLNASLQSVTTVSIFELNYLLANLHVSEVMSSSPITVTEDVPIEEAARVMVENKIGCLPVMFDSELVGMITETDIFETFVEILGGEEANLRVTVLVPDIKGELARVAALIAEQGGNICSVARFRGEEPDTCYLTFRLEGVEEEVLTTTLKSKVKELTHVCCAA
jgi:acetoin utilization protein AcuB